MKKTIYYTLFLIITCSASSMVYSQAYEVNNFTFTGGLSLNSTKYLGNTETNYQFIIGSGLFVTNNVRLGLNFGVKNIKDVQDNFSIEINARKYSKSKNRFSLFGNLSFGYDESESDNIKSNAYQLSVSPGLNYFITDNLAIEASFGELSYASIKPDVTKKEKMNKFNFSVDLTNIKFGIILKRK